MADDPDPIEQLLDAALYVPLGLLLELRERFPELADRGRQHLSTQISVARMVGQFAVQMGAKQVGAFLAGQRPSAAEQPAAGSSGSAAATPEGEEATADDDAADAWLVGAEPADVLVFPDDLPIVGYDTLAASQIVARLDALDAAQLRAVATYESTHRNRKTILGKIAQLQRGP